ncbi:hypothetical protein [Blastococcus sp. SYSU D00813]
MPPAPRRSPRAAPVLRGGPGARHPLARSGGGTAAPQRPQSVPFAVVFAGLVAAEELYLGWLLWEPDPGLYWYVVLAAGLAGWSVLGAVLVWQGRRRAWLVLAAASVLPLLLLLGLALLFGALGDGRGVWWALLLLVGPLGCLVLAAGAPVREWTAARHAPAPRSRSRRDGTAR